MGADEFAKAVKLEVGGNDTTDLAMQRCTLKIDLL